MFGMWSGDEYMRALAFAAKAHQDAGQTVPGTDLPYVVHLSNVAQEVMGALNMNPGRDGTLAVLCAVLHDTLEDTAVTLDTLYDMFGDVVGEGVLALTKNPEKGDKDAQMADSLARLKQQPVEVRMVKLADRIVNLQPAPPHWDEEKKARYKAEAYEIYRALGDADEFLAARLMHRIEAYR